MVAVIVDSFNNYDIRTKYVAAVLEKMGYTVTILSSAFEHSTKSYRSETKEKMEFLYTKPYRKNLSFARIKSHIFFAKSVYKELCVRKPELIYSLLPINSLAKYIYKYKKKNSNSRIYFDVFDLWPESMPINHNIKRLLIPWRNLRDKNLPCADKIFLECEYYKKFLPKNLDYNVVYLCKDKREIKYSLGFDTLEFLYLGSINSIIDIEGIVEFLSKINEIRPVKINIIGGGEKENEFIDKLAAAKIEVIFYGKIFDEEEKDKIVSHCHFGLNMYKGGLCIGLTIKSLDYFCRGLPIISSNIYDTSIMIDSYNCGFASPFNEQLFNQICNLTYEQWKELHMRCEEMYNQMFTSQSVSNIFINNLSRNC